MIKLTPEETEELKSLFKRPWFKLMERIAADMEISVLRQFKNIDISNSNNLAILAKNTQYLKGVEDFLNTIKSWNNQVAERKLED